MGLASVPRLHAGEVAPRRLLAAQGLWILLVSGLLVVLAAGVYWGPAWAWCSGTLGWSRSVLGAVIGAVLGLIVYETANYDLLASGRVVVGTFTAAGRALGLLMAMILVLLVWQQGIAAAIMAFAGAQVLAALVMVGRVWRTVAAAPAAGASGRPPLLMLALRLVRRGWLGQLSALIYLLLLRLDQFLIESFLDITAVGLYAAAAWATELLWLVPEALNPLLVHSAARAAPEVRDATSARAVRLGLGLTVLAAIPLGLLAGPLLSILRDGAFAAATGPLLALLPGVVAFAPGVILAGDFIGRGHPDWNTQASVITVVVNVALCLIWIPRQGILGAAWASSVAYAVGSLVMVIRFRRLTGLPWSTILVPRISDLKQ